MADWATYYTSDQPPRPYYYNTVTKKTQWIKPQEVVEKDKKLKEFEESLKSDPIWEKKKDRFGRETYYNKETKQSHLEKPEHWWTEDEKEAKRKAIEKKKKEEEEAKKKAAEALERRLQPQVKAIIGELKKLTVSHTEENVKKLKEAKEPALPLAGLTAKGQDEAIGPLYKRGAFNLDDVYNARRVPLPAFLTHEHKESDSINFDDPRFGEELCQILFHVSLHWTTNEHINSKRQWDLKLLHIISLYVSDQFFLVDNFFTIPANPMDALFEVRYYQQGYPLVDLEKSGYQERRVQLEPYREASEKRQTELEEADQVKSPICTDEQWITWWSHKAKIKAEMYKAIKMRALYGEGYEGYYDEEIVEEGEEVEGEEEEYS